MSQARSLRWRLLAAALVLPFVGLGILCQRVASSVAGTAAASLDRVAAALPRPSVPPRPIPTHDVPPPPPAPPPAPSAQRGPADLPPPIGVLVRRDRVRAAVNAGVSPPSGRPAPATSYRPAGLALAGVSGLGAGLRDGDVLTRVGGAPATSQGAVFAAVAAALERGHKAITAEAWRGKQRIVVTVELPRLRPRR